MWGLTMCGRALLILLVFIRAATAVTPAKAIEEAQDLCGGDAGALWGVSLCGPLLFVDSPTRRVWANQQDPNNHLQAEGAIFTGKLPNEINIANTATDWAGLKWTMIMLPLPGDAARRRALLAHEMWHRVQEELGFPQSGAANNHLDTRDGRFWLQLEWRALDCALRKSGDERAKCVADALIFRARRRELFPQAAAEEREMEIHEGLAEYTGARLSGAADVERFVATANLADAPEKKTFVRSFAYANGPAYGVLLDATGDDWRKRLRKEDDLGQLLLVRTGIKLPEKIAAAAEARARQYGGDELARSEEQREQTARELITAHRARLVNGPVLTIPLRQMQMQFDPGNLVALEPDGTVYPNIRIVDAWGILTVTRGGALMSADFSRITVPAPAETAGAVSEGDGWKLELNDGWTIAPGERARDFVVQEERKP